MNRNGVKVIAFFLCFCFFELSAQTDLKNLSSIKDIIEKIMANEHQNALMVAIVSKDSILFSGGFGLANIATGSRAGSQTIFPMASITKTFTALAILKLVKQNKLSLSDELSKIAPEVPFTNKWEKTNPVKIIHLLEHTSGFDDLRFNTFWNPDKNMTELQAVERGKNSMYSRWIPGERQAYSNIGYNILGYLIEKISGLKYETFLRNEILLPIGMTNSNFSFPSVMNLNYALPYEWDGHQYVQLPFLQIIGKGSGALYSCADDMAKFVKFMIADSNREIAQMELPESSTPAMLGLSTGYGKGITVDFLSSKFPFYGHDGASVGFNSRYGYNRQLKLGFVVCSLYPNSISEVLVNYLVDSFQVPKPIPTVTVSKEVLLSYEGYYQLKSPRFELLNKYLEEIFHGYHIKLVGDSLHSSGFKRPDQALLPVSDKIFKKSTENVPSFVFTTNNDDKKVLYEWGTYYEKTSYAKVLFLKVLFVGGLVCAIVLFISSLTWLFKAFSKKLTWREFFGRSLSVFGILSLVGSFGALAYMASNVSLMGTVNIYSIVFFIGTILFSVCCLAGFVWSIWRFRQTTNKWVKWYLLVSTAWLIGLVIIYFHYGWIGVKMWSY